MSKFGIASFEERQQTENNYMQEVIDYVLSRSDTVKVDVADIALQKRDDVDLIWHKTNSSVSNNFPISILKYNKDPGTMKFNRSHETSA